MQKVVLPRLFENMEEGTIGRWLVSVGGEVAVGTPLCELITEKTTLELESEVAGTVRQLVAPEKAVVPPGFVLALVGDADEAMIDVTAENAALTGSGAGVPFSSNQVEPKGLEEDGTSAQLEQRTSPPLSASGRLRATPAARRAAKELGVELELVAAKLPGKVLSEDDVKGFAEDAR